MGQDSTGIASEPEFSRTYICPTCQSDGSCIGWDGRCEFVLERMNAKAEAQKQAREMAKRINGKKR